MQMQGRKRSSRNIGMMLDLLYIVVGLLVVICAVMAFLNPEGNQFLFPIIFFLAALLNGVNGWYHLKECGRDRKKRMSSVLLCVVAGALLLVGFVSAFSIWR